MRLPQQPAQPLDLAMQIRLRRPRNHGRIAQPLDLVGNMRGYLLRHANRIGYVDFHSRLDRCQQSKRNAKRFNLCAQPLYLLRLLLDDYVKLISVAAQPLDLTTHVFCFAACGKEVSAQPLDLITSV